MLGRVRAHARAVGSAEIDLADPETIPGLFDQVEKTLGPVDILINNAAHSASDSSIPSPSSIEDWAGRRRSMVDASNHDRHFAVNSRAVALLMAEYARRHVDRGAVRGRIVNVSTDGADCFPGEVSYGASKAALESYSRSAVIELGPYGITVNVVAPGPIQTGWIPAEAEQPIGEEIPLGRIGRPEDVADVIVFLASDQARWVTGSASSSAEAIGSTRPREMRSQPTQRYPASRPEAKRDGQGTLLPAPHAWSWVRARWIDP